MSGFTRFGWWLILSTLNLHLLGSSFARTLLLDRGISNRLRRLLVFGLALAMAGAVWVWAKRTLPALGPADTANLECDSGLRPAGFDRRPGAVFALSVPAGGAAVSCARRRGVFRRARPGAADFFAPLPLGHLFRCGLRGSLGGGVAKTGRAHRRRARRQLAGREEKSKSQAPVVPTGRDRASRHGVVLEKSHRRRPGLFRPPLDYPSSSS